MFIDGLQYHGLNNYAADLGTGLVTDPNLGAPDLLGLPVFASGETQPSFSGSTVSTGVLSAEATSSGTLYTFGASGNASDGVINQFTVNETFGINTLTVTNPATGTPTTIALDNGSTTQLMEGRSAATGTPNEQVQTTEAGGQVQDAIFGQGANATFDNAKITLEQGASANVRGTGDLVQLVANGNDYVGVFGQNQAVMGDSGNDGANLGGVGTSATVDGGGQVGLIDSNQSLTLGDAGSLVLTATGIGGLQVNGSSYTLDLASGDSGNFSGSNATVNLTGNGGDHIGIFGTSQTVTGDTGNDGVNLGGVGTSATVNGGGYVGLINSNQSLTLGDAGSTVGTASAIGGLQVNGSSYSLNLASGDNGNFFGANATVHLTGNSNDQIGIFGQNQTVTGDTGNDGVNLGGVGTTATVDGGGQVGLINSAQSLTLGDTGSLVLTAGGIGGLQVNGSSYTLDLASGDNGNFFGANATVNLTGGGADSIGIFGTNQTVTGDTGNNFVNLGGVGTSATVSGNGYIGLVDSGEVLTSLSAGATIATNINVDNLSINASADTIGVGSGSSAAFLGSNDTIGFNGNDYALISSGTGNIVNNDVAGDSVNLGSNTSTTLTGSGGYFGIVGTNVTVNASGDSALTWQNVSFTLNGNGDTLGIASGSSVTVNGSGDTVGLNGTSYAILSGSNNTLGLSNSDNALIESGTGDVVNNDVAGDGVNLGSDTSTTINGSGGYFGIVGTNVDVTASNDTSYTFAGVSFTLNGSGNTIGLGSNSSATLDGLNNTLSFNGNSYALVESGNGNVVNNDVAGDIVNLGSNTSTTINGSGGYFGIVGTGVNVAASGESSYTFAGISYTLTGNNDTLQLGANASATLIGSNDTLTLNGGGAPGSAYSSAFSYIQGGTGNVVNNDVAGDGVNLGSNTSTTINGSGGYFGIVGNGVNVTASDESSYTIAGASYTLIGSGDSLGLGANASATLIGSNDTLTLNGGGSSGNAFSYIESGTGDVVANDVAGDGVNLGSNTSTTIHGNGGYFGIVGTDVSVIASNESVGTLSGVSFSLTGTGDALNLGASSSVTVTGADMIDLLGSNSVVTLETAGSTVVTASGDTNLTINGSGTVVGLGSGDTANISGTGDTVNLVRNGNDQIGIFGSNQTVTGDTGNDNVNVGGVGSSVTVQGDGHIGLIDSSQTVTLETQGASVLTATGSIKDVINVQSNNEVINASDAIINVAAGETVYVAGSDDKVMLAQNSNSVAVIQGIYNTIDSSGNAIVVNGNSSEITEIGANTVYVNGNSDSINGNGAGGTIDINNNIIAYIHDDHVTVHDGVYDGVKLNGSYDYVETNQYTQTDLYGYGSGDYFTGNINNQVQEQQGSGVYAGNEASSYANNTAEESFVSYDNSLNSGDVNNGGDPGGTGYVQEGGYSYSDSNPDYSTSYYSGNDGGYEGGYDFAGPVAPLRGTGFDVGAIAQYDASVSASGAAAQAKAAYAQALLATESTALAGAATTAVFSGAKWEVAPASDGSRTVTWSFAVSSGSVADPISSAVGSPYQATIEKALQSWSSATGLTFQQVASASDADIKIGFGDFASKSTGVLGYTDARDSGGALKSAVIRLEDPSETALSDTLISGLTYVGTDATLYQVALHEVGRALGYADNADPTSVLAPVASSLNGALDSTDLTGAYLLYGGFPIENASASSSKSSNNGASSVGTLSSSGSSSALSGSTGPDASSLNQLIQGMATFSPRPSALALPVAAQNSALEQQLAAPLHH